MSRLLPSVPLGVKRLLAVTFTLLTSSPLFAVDVDPKLDRAVRDMIPICAGTATVKYQELPMRLPTRFTGVIAAVESDRQRCDGQYVAVLSPTGGVFVGNPWPLDGEPGPTIEQKLQGFILRNMQESMTAVVDRTSRTLDGLFKVTLYQTTEAGKLPLTGVVDAEGKVFFFGQFRPAGADPRTARLKDIDASAAASPAKGPATAPVTVVEFSDFQCPSCQHASGYLDPILAKHGDKVRYVRFDLPLAGHSWAFPAALAGRAIYRQKPEAFWEYKKSLYASQGEMNAFAFWDWARAFAEDHELDLAKYDADLASETLKSELLRGAGLALSSDIRATPTYLVNGAVVDPGDDGKALAEYVEKLVK